MVSFEISIAFKKYNTHIPNHGGKWENFLALSVCKDRLIDYS
jgi:hypothetical protein